ncbi:hypothetical protein [Larkinella rosea]|uniref:Uncharacterized protein n=1 Tax=Larkinella rosea TaxID=2025312 RepID=A0A3P1C0J4_9BACT|nr:hypothetical protein [Larkinella rosea]RRB06314.1 hypothetical protein EHT25_00470 [Larkinella rosea]
MIDWKTIVYSIFGSATISAGVIYILKKGFDKAIDSKFAHIENENKLELVEIKRRQSMIFDKIFEAEKNLLSAVYESRNIIKNDIIRLIEVGDFSTTIDMIKKIENSESIVSEILVKDRILLDDEIFKKSHRFKHILYDLYVAIKLITNVDVTPNENSILEIKTLAVEADDIYDTITNLIKKHYERFNRV